MNKKVIITGGGGFVGAYLVKRMVKDGYRVEVIDSLHRGDAGRFAEVTHDVVLHTLDVRDEDAVTRACAGAELVVHMAAINGTENFYNRPELVLDVGIRGMISVINACRHAEVPDLLVASSAEVYQSPEIIPTPETVPIMLPDSVNPRYSYGGSKIASEVIALNYHRDHFRRLQVFRPHNVYGPDMGWKHVIPQCICRAIALKESGSQAFAIQGDGTETRAFCFVEDIIDGILKMYEHGDHRNIYHIGNDYEVSIATVVDLIAELLDTRFSIETSDPVPGSTLRRCPDIAKMRALGYAPKVDFATGLQMTVEWYRSNTHSKVDNALM